VGLGLSLLHERPHLDSADLGDRVLGRYLDRLVQVGALEHVKPPICPLVSANGPSLTSTSSSRTRTVTASLTGRSRCPCSRTPRSSISAAHDLPALAIAALSPGLSCIVCSAWCLFDFLPCGWSGS
jgi:hypothetical protein